MILVRRPSLPRLRENLVGDCLRDAFHGNAARNLLPGDTPQLRMCFQKVPGGSAETLCSKLDSLAVFGMPPAEVTNEIDENLNIQNHLQVRYSPEIAQYATAGGTMPAGWA